MSSLQIIPKILHNFRPTYVDAELVLSYGQLNLITTRFRAGTRP